eukprot:CAMPEP_0195508344 /NCGR_PEP_ID=MMETSP0794_2-20130614/1574_1 /TAXON_ID=515487 /ORGANISM="Stephanopyxis turris, Strain CCMP 815" /LENGTH=310 /DNA_ID=CAMNT_0040635279 /DNA_START=213 /DNA_END=1145 /DNA_ORIENTATION=+
MRTKHRDNRNNNNNDQPPHDPFNITEEEQQNFHPVVIFPRVYVTDNSADAQNGKKKKMKRKTTIYRLLDRSNNALPNASTLVIRDEHNNPVFLTNPTSSSPSSSTSSWLLSKKDQTKYNATLYTVGKHGEQRLHMDSAEMFQHKTKQIDGYSKKRNIHMGIDLGGPIGTKVHAFCDGILHSVGYGDYGYVNMVVEHHVQPPPPQQQRQEKQEKQEKHPTTKKIWALYGRLDAKTSNPNQKTVGQTVKRGEVLGRLGNSDKNGGWSFPRVHFQISIMAPTTHDMPAVVSRVDRNSALVNYPDPRIVLGPLY